MYTGWLPKADDNFTAYNTKNPCLAANLIRHLWRLLRYKQGNLFSFNSFLKHRKLYYAVAFSLRNSITPGRHGAAIRFRSSSVTVLFSSFM